MPKIKLHKIVGNLLDKLRKLYMHEWNGHIEILSFPQGIENCRQFVLLRTDILQKTVVGCPWCTLCDVVTFGRILRNNKWWHQKLNKLTVWYSNYIYLVLVAAILFRNESSECHNEGFNTGKINVIMVYTSRTNRNLEGDEDGDRGVKAVRNQSIRTTSFECLLYFNKCRRWSWIVHF